MEESRRFDEDEVEEDDVPADFFDDFSNKEFLAGLDVLDEWEDADKQKKEAARANAAVAEGRPHRSGRHDSDENEQRRRQRRRSSSRKRNSRSRSGSQQQSEERRRDPNKTKRDIQRDKVKCAKDKEAKIISEKLRVVETGLVPPGMEMDFDLSELKAKSPARSKRQFSASPSPVRTKRRYVPPPRRRPSPERRYRRPMSRSPVRYRNRSAERRERRSGKTSFLEELDHKLSMRAERDKLRDIQEKINGVSVKYNPAPRPVPAPAPPQPYQPPVYDQQFFIGSQDMQFAPVALQPVPDFINPQYPVPPTPYYHQEPQSVLHSEDVQKLFYDDNISLTNFLNITARSDVSKTIDIKYKVAVITRCQDAIKLMTENAKPSGRFFYRKAIKAPENPGPDAKNVSPLKREPTVRFQFTSKRGREAPATPLDRLLCKLGVKEAAPEAPKEALVAEAAPPPPPGRDDPLRPNVLMKMVQTDFPCDECEQRKAVRTASVGCEATTASVDFGCQVSEDDFLNTARSALKNILKNQSLAALTPAQILAQLGSKTEEKEVFPAARKMAEETAEPVAARHGVTNNDSFPAARYQRPYNPRPPYHPPNNYNYSPHPFFNPGPRRF